MSDKASQEAEEEPMEEEIVEKTREPLSGNSPWNISCEKLGLELEFEKFKSWRKKMFSSQNDIEESAFCEKYLPGLRILLSQVKFLHYFLPILDNSLMSLRAPQIPESLGSIITRLWSQEMTALPPTPGSSR